VNINPEQLLTIIGMKEAELQIVKAEMRILVAQLEKFRKADQPSQEKKDA
jgi:hypothetical protein